MRRQVGGLPVDFSEENETVHTVRTKHSDLTDDQQKKVLRPWLFPNTDSTIVNSIIRSQDVASLHDIRESLMDDVVDLSVLESICTNKNVYTALCSKIEKKKKEYFNEDNPLNFTCQKCNDFIYDEKETSVFCEACLL